MRGDAEHQFPGNLCRLSKKRHLLFFCWEKVAIICISGIITTNLGKTATRIKIAGREKTDTSLQNMPFSRPGEGHFFLHVGFPGLVLYLSIFSNRYDSIYGSCLVS